MSVQAIAIFHCLVGFPVVWLNMCDPTGAQSSRGYELKTLSSNPILLVLNILEITEIVIKTVGTIAAAKVVN